MSAKYASVYSHESGRASVYSYTDEPVVEVKGTSAPWDGSLGQVLVTLYIVDTGTPLAPSVTRGSVHLMLTPADAEALAGRLLREAVEAGARI